MQSDEHDIVRGADSTYELHPRSTLRTGDCETTTDDRLVIVVTHFDGVAVMALRGEIDAYNANWLRDSVAAVCESGVPVVLDMDQVTFMDSKGIAALIAASRFAHELSSSLRITRPSTQVRRILTITGLDTLFLLDRGRAQSGGHATDD